MIEKEYFLSLSKSKERKFLTAPASFHFFGRIQESNGLANTEFDLFRIILVIVLIDQFLQMFITYIVQPIMFLAFLLKFVLSSMTET